MSTVLIVDDEESIRNVTEAILNKAGFECRLAASADEAEAILRKDKIDAVLVDVVLGGRGGLDLLMDLREKNPDLPVIVMSGKVKTSTEQFKTLTAQFGVKCILSKPFTGKELTASVSAILKSGCA